MRLVENWKSAWKWHSTQVLAAIAALPFVWMELPPDAKDMIPQEWRGWIVSVLALAGIVARLRAQGGRK